METPTIITLSTVIASISGALVAILKILKSNETIKAEIKHLRENMEKFDREQENHKKLLMDLIKSVAVLETKMDGLKR